ncbi:hypothetical protein SDC9_120305 [bioreactor metagenome]|uniref:Uncharacterized protein n=1 Tax=bioreactor metagenome TaxID=1076179 RepID=A0A645C6X2_9ZZZZ
MQALVVTTPDQGTTGVLIDDQHLTLSNHVVAIAVEELLGADRVVQIADQRCVRALVEILHT